MEEYLVWILTTTTLVFFLLFIVVVFLQGKQGRKRVAAMNKMIADLAEKKDETKEALSAMLLNVGLSEEIVDTVTSSFIENEKTAYLAIIDGIAGNSYEGLNDIHACMVSSVETCSEYMGGVVVAAEEEPVEEPSEVEEPAEEEEMDLDAMFDEAVEDVAATAGPSPEELDAAQGELEKLKQELEEVKKVERVTRELLDTVLAEFGAMFNITRDSIATMELDEIRALLNGG